MGYHDKPSRQEEFEERKIRNQFIGAGIGASLSGLMTWYVLNGHHVMGQMAKMIEAPTNFINLVMTQALYSFYALPQCIRGESISSTIESINYTLPTCYTISQMVITTVCMASLGAWGGGLTAGILTEKPKE